MRAQYGRLLLLWLSWFVPFSPSSAQAEIRLLGMTGAAGSPDQGQLFDEMLVELNLSDGAAKKLMGLTRISDPNAIGYNPDDGFLYHTSGTESWGDDPGQPTGFRDSQYMEALKLDSGELFPVFNANAPPSPDAVPATGLAAPRPAWVLPKEIRLETQTDSAFRERGPSEYHGLRALTWSKKENLFYGADEIVLLIVL
jgi:hypothetical protein